MAAASLILCAGPAWAHHSFAAEFDANRPLRLDGLVAKLEWANPHAVIYLDVKAPDGQAVSWWIEAASPNALSRRGFTKTSICQGSHVIVEGFQDKSGSHRASGSSILLPNGQRVLLNAR